MTPTELRHIERSFLMKEVSDQSLWTFELRSQQGTSVPKWIIFGFQQQDRGNS